MDGATRHSQLCVIFQNPFFRHAAPIDALQKFGIIPLYLVYTGSLREGPLAPVASP